MLKVESVLSQLFALLQNHGLCPFSMAGRSGDCPVCGESVPVDRLNAHVLQCLDGGPPRRNSKSNFSRFHEWSLACCDKVMFTLKKTGVACPEHKQIPLDAPTTTHEVRVVLQLWYRFSPAVTVAVEEHRDGCAQHLHSPDQHAVEPVSSSLRVCSHKPSNCCAGTTARACCTAAWPTRKVRRYPHMLCAASHIASS